MQHQAVSLGLFLVCKTHRSAVNLFYWKQIYTKIKAGPPYLYIFPVWPKYLTHTEAIHLCILHPYEYHFAGKPKETDVLSLQK